MTENSDSRFFAPCTLGIEAALAEELALLGARSIDPIDAGVWFEGDRRLAYRANLWLRTAIRVQELILEFPVRAQQDVYEAAMSMDWSRYMSVEQTLAVDASTRDSVLPHSKYAGLLVKDAVCDWFREKGGTRPSVDRDDPHLALKLAIHGERGLLYRNLSGISLHKRGWRPIQVVSPLNESLAAGLIRLSGWDRNSAFVDPMCGSGTFVIEAALLASGRAPGLGRHFAFESAPDFDAGLWEELLTDARDKVKTRLDFPILGADRHGGALEIARLSARNAGVDQLIRFSQSRAVDLVPGFDPKWVLCNPPYGKRLGSGDDLIQSWVELGNFLHSQCVGAEAWILSGNREVTRNLGLRTSRKLLVRNGSIDCRFLRYEIVDRDKPAPKRASHEEAIAAAIANYSGAAVTRFEPDEVSEPEISKTEVPRPEVSRPEAPVESVPVEEAPTGDPKDHPLPWVEASLGLLLEGGRVLDLAAGRGRHSRLLLEEGHTVTAVDKDIALLGDLVEHPGLETLEVDLEDGSPWPLEGRIFDVILVTNYLWRPIMPKIVECLAPGGILIYETFATGQEEFGKPENTNYLLDENELLEAFAPDLVVLAYEHGVFEEPEPAIKQRILARMPDASVADAPPVAAG